MEIHAASQTESCVLGWSSEESLCSQFVLLALSTCMLARLESGDLVKSDRSPLLLGEAA